MRERVEPEGIIGDYANRAQHDQKPGRAEEAADNGVGYVTDGAAHPRQAKTAQYDAGHDG